MKIAEIRALSVEALKERLAAEEANYNTLVLNHSIAPLENPAQIKFARRAIAQMKTVLREAELNN